MRKTVVLLHGIARGRASMRPLERAAAAMGYRVLNLDYPSTRLSLEQIADWLHRRLAEADVTKDDALHFACHSMGGLVARAFIHRYRPENLGRAVFLGTPNKGSEIADILGGWPAYRRFFGPAGQQLTTNNIKVETLIGPIDFPALAIAGTRAVDFACWMALPKPNDGRVSVQSATMNGAMPSLILPVTHPFMMRNSRVITAALAFVSSHTVKGRAAYPTVSSSAGEGSARISTFSG